MFMTIRMLGRGVGHTRRRYGPSRRAQSTWEHHEAQHAVYVGPWMLIFVAGFAGQIAHALYATSEGGKFLVLLGIFFATVALSYVGYLDTHERTRLAIGHTLVTVISAGAWLCLAAVTGIFAWERTPLLDGRFSLPLPLPQRPTLDLWLLGGAVLAVMWNMRQSARVSEARTLAMREQVGDDWTEAGFPGTKGGVKRVNEYRSEGTGTVPKGVYLEQLQKNARSIESAMGWPSESLTLLPYGKGATSRRFRMVVMHQDPLEGSVEWPGVDA